MQENPSEISLMSLPEDILLRMRPMFPVKDLCRLTRTCKGLYGIFQPEIHYQQLKMAVENGKRDQVEQILTTYPDLLLRKSQGTDSPFQMAARGLNWHMWTIMLKYLPKEKYQQAGAQLQGPHYDATPLIEALRNYVQRCEALDYDNSPDRWKEAELTQPWCKNVGQPQRLIPIALALEYCRRDRHSFDPTPNYKIDSAPPLDTNVRFYDETSGDFVSWFSLPAGLGNAFAIIRSLPPCLGGAWFAEVKACASGYHATKNLAAITAWYEAGTEKLRELKQMLQNPTPSEEAAPSLTRQSI